MLRVGIMLPSRETAMTGEHDVRGLVEFARAAEAAGFDSVWVGDSLLARTRAQTVRKVTPALYATVNLNGVRADDELDQYLHHVERLAVVGAHYVDAGTQHLVLRIGSLTAHPESLAEQLLPALEETGSS
jgi:alkanesulfonate monooxygenase SsuD/methylene tetrahydromethanopterin reductase-like flavin-dependent oxidoreductase (luciferase family)